MDLLSRLQHALDATLRHAEDPGTPPRLQGALRHAVFPGGARIRPQLCLAVASACGDDAPALSDAAAVAIELLHCASLVHDDLPAFDDADTRRGEPTVHKVYGEPLALLAGDALIVMAFQTLARAGAEHPARLAGLVATVANGVGAPHGIVAGQAWECEPTADLGRYQRAKTGALFVAATRAGALAAGANPAHWTALGECLGEAYQVADDIRDVLLASDQLGKPAGQDAAHHRPSAANDLGLRGALDHFHGLMQAAVDAVPDGPARGALQALVRHEAERLLPASALQRLSRLPVAAPATPARRAVA